jgi:hypothetical protein
MALVSLVAAETAAAADAPDAAAIREAAARRVCLVTAENALGAPLAYASGFLLGEGRFAITDLASVARPDVKQVRLRFRDGAKATAQEFGMADPAIGLVAVRLDQPPAGLSGLAIPTASASEDPGEVTVVGHKWAQDLDFVIGRFSHVVSSGDLAARLKIGPPKQAGSFFSFAAINPEQASGSPVLDGGGNVVGIVLRVAGADKPLVVPASALWESLKSADRQLRPLAELPKPFWPVAVLPVPGKACTPQDFAQSVRSIKVRSLCSQCKGKGTITVRKLVESRTVGGIQRNTFKDETQTCPTCRGEGVVFPEGLYAQYVRMAEAGTWLASAGGVEPKVRDTTFANCLDLLKAVSKVGRGYRDDLMQEIKSDLSKNLAGGPHGVVVFAVVRESVDGPDGPYVMLAPHGSGATFAAKADRMAAAAEVRGTRLKDGHSVILAGLAVGNVSLGGQRATYVQPFAWADGPGLGLHEHKPGGPGAPETPSQSKPSGSPTFFGL